MAEDLKLYVQTFYQSLDHYSDMGSQCAEAMLLVLSALPGDPPISVTAPIAASVATIHSHFVALKVISLMQQSRARSADEHQETLESILANLTPTEREAVRDFTFAIIDG